MKFTDFDSKLRIYEESIDQCILSNYLIARLDGRSFSKLTKIFKFDKPFDQTFKWLMTITSEYLIKNSGFNIKYAYFESDEISLLFNKSDTSFNHKIRKLISILSGCASAIFSSNLNHLQQIEEIPNNENIFGVFDCRLIPLPDKQTVIDYFLWRQEDANRNALNSYCYWTLRNNGYSKGQATSELCNKSISFKNELLFQNGINYNNVDNWQKRGIGLYKSNIVKETINKATNKPVSVKRTIITINENLEYGQKYAEWLLKMFLNDEK